MYGGIACQDSRTYIKPRTVVTFKYTHTTLWSKHRVTVPFGNRYFMHGNFILRGGLLGTALFFSFGRPVTER